MIKTVHESSFLKLPKWILKDPIAGHVNSTQKNVNIDGSATSVFNALLRAMSFLP